VSFYHWGSRHATDLGIALPRPVKPREHSIRALVSLGQVAKFPDSPGRLGGRPDLPGRPAGRITNGGSRHPTGLGAVHSRYVKPGEQATTALGSPRGP
jgi:hypothetical protein